MKIATGYRVLDGSELAWIDKSANEGFRYMELATSALPSDSGRRDAVIRYAKECGFTASIHAPYGTTNITSSDPLLRAESLGRVRDAIILAARHELSTVTVHPGRLSSPEESPADNIALMLDTVAELAELARSLGVRLGLENMELRKNELIRSVDELNVFAPIAKENPYLGVTIDFVHYSTLGLGMPDLSALKLPIYDVHLSQNVDGVTHLSLTKPNGIVDLTAVFRSLTESGYDGLTVLEIRDGHAESLRLLNNMGMGM